MSGNPTSQRLNEAPNAFDLGRGSEPITVDMIITQDSARRDLPSLNALNQSHRNSLHKASIYAQADDEHSLKYYQLGKSA